MQGLNYLDLAKNIADSHLNSNGHPRAPQTNNTSAAHRTRNWIGRRLIDLGERLVPPPRDLQLKVSTGPPCP